MEHVFKHHPTKKNIADTMKANVSARSEPSTPTMFDSFPNFNIPETGTGQVRQLLRASFAVAMYAEKDPQVREFFYTLFYTGQSPVVLINGGQFLQTVLDSLR